MSDTYERAYRREKASRLIAEKLLEDKATELYFKNTELESAYSELKQNQQQLVRSEKMASVGLLAAGIAHEINNPVGFSLSNLQVMQDYLRSFENLLDMLKGESGLSEHVLKHLEEFQQNILQDMKDLTDESRDGLETVKQIVVDLRGFSRQDDKKKALNQVNEGLRASINVLRNELKYRCEVDTELGEVPPILCNLAKLNQVFANLILNASQAMNDQGRISVRSFADENWLNIVISDTGTGIPPDQLKHIFDPFYTTKPVGEGTGLGLSISYAIIVDEHEGKLDVDSTLNEGTTFTIRLPLITEASE